MLETETMPDKKTKKMTEIMTDTRTDTMTETMKKIETKKWTTKMRMILSLSGTQTSAVKKMNQRGREKCKRDKFKDS